MNEVFYLPFETSINDRVKGNEETWVIPPAE